MHVFYVRTVEFTDTYSTETRCNDPELRRSDPSSVCFPKPGRQITWTHPSGMQQDFPQ